MENSQHKNNPPKGWTDRELKGQHKSNSPKDGELNDSIGGGAIFFLGGGGGFSGETKIAEGIRDAKNRRFVLYIAFAGKSGGL